jgi:hypothetical protein
VPDLATSWSWSEDGTELTFKLRQGVKWHDGNLEHWDWEVPEEYEGTARIARRVFQHLLDQSPTPERCMEAFHLQRTRFELIVERKLRRRQLTDDGNIEITGRDLREKVPVVGQHDLFDGAGPHGLDPTLRTA